MRRHDMSWGGGLLKTASPAGVGDSEKAGTLGYVSIWRPGGPPLTSSSDATDGGGGEPSSARPSCDRAASHLEPLSETHQSLLLCSGNLKQALWRPAADWTTTSASSGRRNGPVRRGRVRPSPDQPLRPQESEFSALGAADVAPLSGKLRFVYFSSAFLTQILLVPVWGPGGLFVACSKLTGRTGGIVSFHQLGLNFFFF